MKSKVQRNIMRRVWYAYAILHIHTQLTTMAFWQGVLFGGSLLIFANVVHVASVFRNTLETPLARIPEYVLTAVLNAAKSGDLAKVITLLLLVSITISMLKKVTHVSGLMFLRQRA